MRPESEGWTGCCSFWHKLSTQTNCLLLPGGDPRWGSPSGGLPAPALLRAHRGEDGGAGGVSVAVVHT